MTLNAFVKLLAEKTSIPAHRIMFKVGFPPKPVVDGDPSAAITSVFSSGEALIVEESDMPSVQVKVAQPTVKRPQAPNSLPSLSTSGCAVRRIVDADNSCLFTSLGYVLLGKDRLAGMRLRDAVVEEILADPETYNEAVLNMEPTAYADWIKDISHWGGGVELAVLADHFSSIIVAWDIQTLRTDRFGEEKGYKQCVHLIYDGLHYDALALSMLEDVPPESEDFDVTVFHPEDKYMESQARAVVTKLNNAKQFTNTANFTLRCLVCQKGLVGEADAVAHAKETAHQNFAEYN